MAMLAGRPTFAQQFSAALAEAQMRLLSMSRYPGQLVMDILIPVIFAAMPMLLGRTGGAEAAANFRANTGTSNYVAYLLIGSNVFMIVSLAFWNIAYWLRGEQETGTLEALYLTPTSRMTLIVVVLTLAGLLFSRGGARASAGNSSTAGCCWPWRLSCSGLSRCTAWPCSSARWCSRSRSPTPWSA